MALDLKKLKGMKMPSKSMPEKEASDDLDLESLGEEAEGAEMASAAAPEMGAEMAMDGELAELSDEDLLQEVMKRGLASELEKMSSPAAEESASPEEY